MIADGEKPVQGQEEEEGEEEGEGRGVGPGWGEGRRRKTRGILRAIGFAIGDWATTAQLTYGFLIIISILSVFHYLLFKKFHHPLQGMMIGGFCFIIIIQPLGTTMLAIHINAFKHEVAQTTKSCVYCSKVFSLPLPPPTNDTTTTVSEHGGPPPVISNGRKHEGVVVLPSLVP